MRLHRNTCNLAMSGNGVPMEPGEINEGVESGTPPDEIQDGTRFLESSSFTKRDSIKSPVTTPRERRNLNFPYFFFLSIFRNVS